MYYTLPLTNDPRQVFTLDLTVDGEALHLRMEVRYLPAPDLWILSVWDNSTEELLVNQIPLRCSVGQINDLLLPFRHLREGKGLGSLFVLRDVDEPDTPDPAKETLLQFAVLIGDTYE